MRAVEPESPALRKLLERIRRDLDPDFAFRDLGPIPWTAPARPPAESRVAILTTGGFHRRDDPPFRIGDGRVGDPSFRFVGHETPIEDLALDAPTIDRKYVPDDPEVALPRRALDALVAAGSVGSAAPRHVSFCPGLLHPLPGLADSAEELAPLLREDVVDVVVLLATCSLCVQNVAVLGRELESRGLSTVGVSLLPELTAIVGAPRTLTVKFPFGAPVGDPRHPALHRAVLGEALSLLDRVESAGESRASAYEWRRPPAPTSPA